MAAPTLTGRVLARGVRPAPALWLGIGLAIAAFAVVVLVVAPGEMDDPALPPELAAEPDLYVEDGRITQHDEHGRVRYRLRAKRISHFERRDDAAGETRMDTLAFELPDAAMPWRGRADRGHAASAPGEGKGKGKGKEERLRLVGNVELSQQRRAGAFTRLSTDALTLLPERRLAESDQAVIIVTENSRMSAAGFKADLASGRIRLLSSTEQRVRVVARTSQAAMRPRLGT